MKRIRSSLSPLEQFLHTSLVPTRRTLTTTSTPTRTPTSTLPPSRDPLRSAKLAALHARLLLHPKFPVQTLARALIDPTADPNPAFNNDSLATLGNTITGYYASEFLMCTYPRLPSAVLYAAMNAYVGPAALAAIGREWGVENAFSPTPEVDAGQLQFKRLQPGAQIHRSSRFAPAADRPGVAADHAMANFVRSAFAGVYIHEGPRAAKQFFRHHVLSRRLEMDKLFNFTQPTRELSRLCAREGFEPPVARLLSETGRKSIAPVFVVGVYSGPERLGEGQGASLNEARIRAAANALKSWYLYKPVDVDLPSNTDENPSASFKPALIDSGEVIV
ncbi:54S ribosomal protein L3 mitochondrial [Rhizina undulata]